VKLERFCLKFLARPETQIDPQESIFINIFQEWIRLQSLPGVLIDVADYRHVPDGPGIMLITHEINYALDRADGELGLYAQRKRGQSNSLKELILEVARATATFGKLLEADQRLEGSVKLNGGKFYWMSNDRLLAPNTEEAFAAVKPELEAALQELYPNQNVNLSRVENDERDRLCILVETEKPVDIGTLAQPATAAVG
jgi:hypothetical protein